MSVSDKTTAQSATSKILTEDVLTLQEARTELFRAGLLEC